MSISIILTFVLIVISFIAFIFGVFYLMARYKRIMLSFCFVFVAVGFLLYTASYLSSGTSLAASLFAALRGILSVARMFFINDDHSVLVSIQGAQWLTENIYVQIIFWLCHVAALIIVQTALIALFGRKLIDSFRLRFGHHKEVYIIKGSDKNAFLLAENIATHDAVQKHPDKKRLIVFLLEEDDDEKKIYEKTSRFDGIAQVLDRNHDLLYCLKKTRLGKRNWLRKEKKYTIILMPKNESAPDNASLIAEFAKKKNVNPDMLDIFVFVSSEWDRKKIEEITQARKGDQRKYPYTFHIVNEVDLLVRQMIEKHPPFECPGLNFSGGAASRNFTVMILGFGAVGQSALLHLVMNGQFVKSSMRAIIVDRDIEHLREHFLHCYPSLKQCCEIEFMPFDVRETNFYKLLNGNHYLDYVVVSLNDDILNKQTALDIQLHYKRKDIKELPFIAVSGKKRALHDAKQDKEIFIFGCREDIYKESVIIREKADRMAKAVNDVYNNKNPKKAKLWTERDWFEQESNRALADFIPAMLKLAGIQIDNVPKESHLVKNNDTLVEVLAQTEHLRWNAFHVAMGWQPISIEEMRQRFDGTSTRESTARLHVCLVSWDKLDEIGEAYKEDFKKYDREIIEKIPSILSEAQKANCKKKLRGLPMYKPKPIDTKNIILNNEILVLCEVLAKNTHEVWASGRITDGWTYGDMRNDVKKEHPCLIPYEELPESEKEYDRATAMETLKVIMSFGYVVIKG